MTTTEGATVCGETTIRVRYAETDRMGLLHHANYLIYFEQGRTELLRSLGVTYRDLEDQGYLLVITKVEVHYRRPAYYDDLLTLRTTVARTTSVRIDHAYEVFRDGVLVAEGRTTLACVDREGRPQPLPDLLRGEKRGRESFFGLPASAGRPENDSRPLFSLAFGLILSLLGCAPPPGNGKPDTAKTTAPAVSPTGKSDTGKLDTAPTTGKSSTHVPG